MNWDVGQTLLEQYQIRQVFTSGGMGLVYQVSHLDWGKRCAGHLWQSGTKDVKGVRL